MRRSSAPSQLALWIGRKGRGAAHLRWGQRELVVHVVGLQIVGVQGGDNDRLEAGLGLTSGGDWFADAASAVAAGQVTQAEANAIVKRALADDLREFLLADDATATFDTRVVVEVKSLTISYPHLITELLLGAGGEDYVGVYLPSPSLVLRRMPDFLRRVGMLGLTEEAMAVLAKINDQRTAQEIADPSPHGRDLALRLLAAAVGAGLVEGALRLAEEPLAAEAPAAPEAQPPRRRVWLWVVLLVMLVAAAVALALIQPWKRERTAGLGGPWGVAVDMGCQSTEMERLYRRQSQDSENLRLVKFMNGDQPCYRLVWGHFADRGVAEEAIRKLPDGLLMRGFAPHAVLPESTSP